VTRGPEERRPGSDSSAAAAAAASALLAFNLAVVGPATVYAGNVDEYSASFWSVLPHLAVAACLLALVPAAALLLVPRRFRGRPVVLVFSLAILAWLQGNWLLGNFGLLDGGALDLDTDARSRFRDGALWLGGIAAAQLVYPFLRRHVGALAGVFLALQALALPLTASTAGSSDSDAPESLSLIADDEIFAFSSGRNIVLLILDTLTSDTFVRLADRDPEHYDRAFSGFVVYSDTTGAFPSTQYALPVMLGAPPYDNRIPVDDYMDASLQRDAITTRLLERGYAVDWVSAWPLFCRRGSYSTCYAIPRPYAPPGEYRRRMAAELVDISLLRHAPYGLKRRVYAGGAWLVQAALWGERAAPVFVTSAADFFSDFNAAIRIGRAAPTFKIVHTAGGHGPFVLDRDCAPVPSGPHSRASYERQVRCGLKQTAEFLERLRALGVYDDALIIVAGDHGASFGVRGHGSHGLTPARLARARPLLAVKWPGAAGGLVRSRAPASLQDIAPTIAAAAGLDLDLPGRDLAALDPEEQRRRAYGLYVLRKGTPGGHLERVERYAVSGDSRRPDAWQFEGAVFSPSVALAADHIEAGEPAGAGHLSYLGWGAPRADAESAPEGASYVPAIGPVATVFAELPQGAPLELRARLRARPWSLPQVVSVELDGVPIGSWRIEESRFGEHSVAIPAHLVGARTAAISFLPQNHQRPGTRDPASAFDLDWIRVQPAPRP
jgi:hypothetical protein